MIQLTCESPLLQPKKPLLPSAKMHLSHLRIAKFLLQKKKKSPTLGLRTLSRYPRAITVTQLRERFNRPHQGHPRPPTSSKMYLLPLQMMINISTKVVSHLSSIDGTLHVNKKKSSSSRKKMTIATMTCSKKVPSLSLSCPLRKIRF